MRRRTGMDRLLARRIASVGAAAAVLAGCTGTELTGARESGWRDARPLPDETGETREPVDLPTGHVKMWPSSTPVETGVAYRFVLGTHCGLDVAAVDFDGSFWRFAGPGPADDGNDNPPAGWGNPSERGTITLLDEETAEFRGESGHVARFARHDGPAVVPLCM